MGPHPAPANAGEQGRRTARASTWNRLAELPTAPGGGGTWGLLRSVALCPGPYRAGCNTSALRLLRHNCSKLEIHVQAAFSSHTAKTARDTATPAGKPSMAPPPFFPGGK